MKISKLLLSVCFVSSLCMFSCNDYLDINDDPNNIHLEKIDPELILPGAISQIYRTQATWMNRFGGIMMNSYAGNSYVFGSPFSTDFALTVNNSFYPQIWDGIYRGVANFALIESYDNSSHRYDNYNAIAKIMKAYYMQIIVDLYGDVPYKEAFQGQKNTTPKYDKDSDVYKELISELEKAIVLIKLGHKDAIKPSESDIIFNGEMQKWIVFANTIKLKYLIRMSNVSGELEVFRDQKLRELAGEVFINDDVFENPGYSSANNEQQNPFTNYYIVTSDGRRPQNYTLYTVSEHFAISLNGNPTNDARPYYQRFKGIIDGRRNRIFTLEGGVLKGIRQGATPGQEGAPSENPRVSKIGAGLIVGQNPGVTVVLASSRSGILMTKAEAKFLLAEAGLRYPGVFSGDKDNFIQGILASYNYLGVKDTEATKYLNAIESRNGLGWLGSFEDKIEAIMTQKWIASTGINPIESFFDYNRTGYPITPLPTTTTRSNRPFRLVYPVSEYVANSVNVPRMSNEDAFTINQYTPFWVKR